MRANQFKRGEDIEVEITKMAFGGRGIAKIETEKGEIVVFVPNTISGQKVRCRIAKVRKRHLETKLLEVLERAPSEVEVPYQAISGAPFATLPIALQEQMKKETTIDLLGRIGKVENAEALFDELISSPLHWHYRNKMEYSFAAIRYDLREKTDVDDFALGFKHRGTWWMVENLDKDSGLFDEEMENGLRKIREYCENTGLPAWHHPKKEGFFRFLTVRKSHTDHGLILNLVTSSSGLERFDLEKFSKFLQDLLGERLQGLLHTVNDDVGDRVQPLEGESDLILGKDYIVEKLSGLSFRIQMESFFQTNPRAAERLYAKAIDYLSEETEGKGLILDLFCGTGTIGQLVGSKLTEAEIIGVDIVAKAIEDAKRSAVENGVSNVRFEAADVGKFLLHHPEYKGKIDAIILDPPRGGIAPKALKRTIELEADTLVYISCNPATLARDTEVLQQQNYDLKKFALVDQFPHTGHVEAVALFKKNKAMDNWDKNYWQERWDQSQTGWDIGYAAPALTEFAQGFSNKNIRILIPGCGNGYEAEELIRAGYKNTFVVDLAPGAFESLKKRFPEFPDENMILGNFFNLKETYDLILEQTFFCALDPSLRPAYAKKMHELLAPGGTLAGVLFDDVLFTDHPPFGGNKEEYLSYFEELFEVKTMETARNSIKPRQERELFFQVRKPI